MIKQLQAFRKVPSAGNQHKLYQALTGTGLHMIEPIPESIKFVPMPMVSGFAVIAPDPDGYDFFMGLIYHTDDGWFTMASDLYMGTFATKEEAVTNILAVYNEM